MTGQWITPSELTESSVDDGAVGVTVIEQMEATITRFTADGVYDTRAVYEALVASGATHIRSVIPPKKTAAMDPRAAEPWRRHNDAIERIADVGRRQWRKEAGAHQQAQAENGMFRYKRVIGDGLRARKFEAQKREASIAVNVLNRMTELGMPKSEAIAA
ncbi:MAG: transposase [bacterium]|nr:transposase [bacterium]